MESKPGWDPLGTEFLNMQPWDLASSSPRVTAALHMFGLQPGPRTSQSPGSDSRATANSTPGDSNVD